LPKIDLGVLRNADTGELISEEERRTFERWKTPLGQEIAACTEYRLSDYLPHDLIRDLLKLGVSVDVPQRLVVDVDTGIWSSMETLGLTA
jgi:hypothetical protein